MLVVLTMLFLLSIFRVFFMKGYFMENTFIDLNIIVNYLSSLYHLEITKNCSVIVFLFY